MGSPAAPPAPPPEQPSVGSQAAERDHRPQEATLKLLLIDDEERVTRVLSRALAEEGHQVDVCATGDAARTQALDIAYDVVLLDWSLRDVDGVTVLRDWRSRGLRTPVILITARGTTGEKVTALRAGADDYLVKPFALPELLARLEALHRRTGADPTSALGPVVLDARRRALAMGERAETLTAREYGLLQALAERRGEVLSRSRLLESVWRTGFDGNPNVVDVYVGYVRAKLARLGADTAVRIESVRGVGYRLVVEVV